MTINLTIPGIKELKPRITVFGVGGAGGNAVNNMITSGLEGVEFVCANTDAQALALSKSERVIQLGVSVTEGLGAGSHPEVGRAAAEESYDEISDHLSGSHMVFITGGMGGGTGTGAAPVVARVAREQGILTVGVVTKPFEFEGHRRMRLAEDGIDEMHRHVDTLIVIPNQNLFRVANEKTTFAAAFAMADEVLYSGVACVTDLMVKEGLINLDFADVRAVMRGMGKAMMGTGEATGEDRARHAAEAAIANPLLDDVSMRGARGLLISITGSRETLGLYEIDEAASRIREEVDGDANIILGATFDDSLGEAIRVSVVATGTEAAMVQAMDPVVPNAARAITLQDRKEEAPSTLEADVAAAVTASVSTQEPKAAETDDGVRVEPYTPSARPTQAMEEEAQQPEAPMPKVHVPSHAVRPDAARRMPRQEELPRAAQQELNDKPGEVRNARALFSRLASNVGLNISMDGHGTGAPEDNGAADDSAARSAIEASNARPAPRTASMGAAGQADATGRANPQQLQKDHLEIPSFLRKHS